MPTAEAVVSSRTQRTARHLDRDKTLELHEQGVSPKDIAQHQGVARTTVWRFLESSKPERIALENFKRNRADALAKLQGMCLDVQARIIRTLDDGVIGALKQGEKTGLLMAINATAGTCFDKERLERGESTANHSIVSTMVDARVGKLYKAPQLIENGLCPTPTVGARPKKKGKAT